MNPVINKLLIALATFVAELAVVIDAGLTQQEGLILVLAFLGALGVYAVPNAAKRPV